MNPGSTPEANERPRSFRRAITRGRAAIVAALVVMVSTLLGAPTSLAAFDALTTTAATFQSAPCFYRANVQKGTVTSTAEGITSVAIAPVDPARSFLMFTSRHDSNRPVGSQIGGELASSTTLQFTRATDETTPVPMTIEWSVIEYPCGVTVQRGSTAQTTATVDVTIGAVASVAQAFVLWSKTPYRLNTSWDGNDPLAGELTGATNLQFRADSLDVSHFIWWQIVEFTDPTMITVQHGTTSLAGAATSTQALLATTVDPARSFVLVGSRSTGSGVDVASGLVRARITGPGTVTLDRGAANYDVPDIAWQVVELRDGSKVQSGNAVFASGTATVTPSISAVNPARTTAFAPIQSGGGQNAGLTTYVADDIIGVAAAGLRVTSATQLTLTRDSTVGNADIPWFVVSWGLP